MDINPRNEEISAPFTAAQIVRIRELIQEELVAYDKRKSHEARYGKPYPADNPYPPKERK